MRTARNNPGFVVAATCTLALAIGANAAIFSIVSGVLLRPLPFSHPEDLVQLNHVYPRGGPGAVFYLDLEEFRKQSTTFEQMIAYGNTSKILLDGPDPERIQTVWAERGLFQMLGVMPMLGRTFREDDPPNVAVLGAGLWKRRFGADPSCIGRKITLDTEPYTVIGVMPEGFQFPYRGSSTELWVPWTMSPGLSRNRRVDHVVARIRSGVTLDTARMELTTIASRLEAQYPDTNKGRRILITPLSEIVTGRVRAALLSLLGAVGMVLLIACANVTNLLLARGARRTHEIAVRAALGAGRGRLLQQLLTESIFLSLIGGLGGLLIATAGTRAVLKVAAAQIPRSGEIGLDWRVFCFLVAASVGAGIAFGILPALTMSRGSPQAALQHAGRGGSPASGFSGGSGRWLRDGLVVAEIALSFVLLVSAGLLLRAFLRLQDTPVGLVADNVLTMRMSIILRDYSAPGSYGRYVHELESRLREVPGVRSAGFIQFLPLQNWGWSGYFSIDGHLHAESQAPQSELRYVSPGYFQTLGIPLRRGRLFTDHDTPDSPRVILINEALARKYFPNEEPVGQRTDRGVIVGVVGDVRTSRLDRPPTPEIYYSFAQNTAATSDAGVSLVVRMQSRPEALVSAVREAIRQVNPHQAVFGITTMERVIADSLADMNLYLWLTGVFAGIAVLLAVSGVYGVISYVVAARTHEFGIRLALGAGSAQILRLVLGHGSGLIACGLVVGVAGTQASARVLSALGGVTSTDPATLAVVGVVLAGVALAACFIPARRAMRVDPNVALKYE